jgi:hypothetical protein
MKRYQGNMEHDDSDGEQINQRLCSVIVDMSLTLRVIHIIEQELIASNVYPVGKVHVGLFHDFPIASRPGLKSSYMLLRGLKTMAGYDMPNLYELCRLAAYSDDIRPKFDITIQGPDGEFHLGEWWVFSGRFLMGNVDFDLVQDCGQQCLPKDVVDMMSNFGGPISGEGGIDA